MQHILNIVDPPKAEIGKTYMGRVVNITKFGAFVNILPGRDGLVHISKLGGGRRIKSVEDVLELGQEIEVVVEEIDDRGKVSLTPAENGDVHMEAGADYAESHSDGADGDDGATDTSSGNGDGVETVSFEESFDAELASELGDLGPAGESRGGGGGGGRRRRHR